MHGSGIDGHEMVKTVLLLRRVVFPEFDGGRARCFFPRGVDDAELLLAGDAGVPQCSPAFFVLAAKLRDGVRRRLQREVRSVVAEVQVKRLLRGERLVDEFESESGPQVGGIPVLRQTRVVVGDGLAVEEELGLRLVASGEVKAARRGIQRAIKATFPRHDPEILAHMPLARHRGEVARRPQHLTDGHAGVIEPTAIARHTFVIRHVTDPCLMRIQTGEQRGACGAAAAGVVELGEAKPVLRERIEVRRGNLRAIAAKVREAHVIDEDHDDVRTLLRSK